ncbi:MAG: ABC transporter permease [Synoicihabitans sp.]
MRFFKSLWIGLRGYFRRGRAESEMDEELQFHLEMEIENNLRQGMTQREAERVARVAMGGIDQAKEASRDAWGLRGIADLARDLRMATRSLTRAPGFAGTAMLTLGIGIGACAIMFSVVHAVMLQPLGVRDQDRLVYFWENNLELGIERFSQSVPNFVDYREQSQSFDALIGVDTRSVNLSDKNRRPVQADAVKISRGFSETFGWPLLTGREFSTDEDQPGGPKVVLLSEALWRERYGADPGVLDRSIQINREPHRVVGVISGAANLFGEADLWLPLAADPLKVDRDDHWLVVIGRLADGVSLEQAQAEVDTLATRLREAHPESNKGWGGYLETVYDQLVPPQLTRGLNVLFAAVGLLMLIACANVANLLLSQALARDHELAVRGALGASRWHIMRQLLCEAAVLAFGGTLLSLLMASWGIDLLQAYTPADALPRGEEIALRPPILVFTASVGVATVLIAGLIPALRFSRPNPAVSLGSASRSIGLNVGQSRTRSGLVIVQVALSLVLVVGAGLLLRSYQNLQSTDPGYRSDNVLTFRMTPDNSAYGDPTKRLGLFDRLKSQISALPGVTRVGITSGLPFGDGTTSINVFARDASAIAADESIQVSWRIVDSNYFDALGIPLVAGRKLEPTDDGSNPVVVVSRKLAEQFWPTESALGKRISPGGGDNTFEIAGVVEDIRLQDLTGVSERPQIYVPLRHWTGWPNVSVAVHTDIDPATLANPVREIVRKIDPEQPVYSFNTLADLTATATRDSQFQSGLFGVFAAFALLLAAVGIFAVMQTVVTQRRREIGIRMALGARPGETLALLFRQGSRPVLWGLAIGAVLLWPVGRVLEQQLFETSAWEPVIFGVAALTLLVSAALAIALPARRALRINPIEALRTE